MIGQSVVERALLSASVVLVVAAEASGQCQPLETAQLVSPDGAEGDQLGVSTAIDGDTAVVGAWRSDSRGANAGSAWVFTRDGQQWHAHSRLTASDAGGLDLFGVSTDIDRDTIVIGARGYDDGSAGNVGAAYVYARVNDSWVEQSRLHASDGRGDDAFGASVAVSGNTLVAGADKDDSVADVFQAGSAYIFIQDETEWTEDAKLTLLEPGTWDQFGQAVALDGDTLVIGAPSRDVAGQNAGAAYVFVRVDGTWRLLSELVASDASRGAFFGHSVAVCDDTIVAGAYLADSAYVFSRRGDTWMEEAVLVPTIVYPQTLFGTAVTLEDDLAIVTAIGEPAPMGFHVGAAYVFARHGDSWHQKARLTSFDGASTDVLGSAAALSGSTAVIGALGDKTEAGEDAGSARVFELKCPGSCAADCDIDGIVTMLDYLCFQGLVTAGDPAADCNEDGAINVFDFLCFQGLVAQGCR